MPTIKKLYTASGVAITAPTELITSGVAEINVVQNPNNADSGWASSGAGITVATTSTASDLPLSGSSATAIKITPASGTNYIRYRFTMPAALKNQLLKIEWFQRPLSGYTSGDLKVEIHSNSASNYGGSYTEFALSTDVSGTSSIPNLSGRYMTTFASNDADYYELRIVRTAGTTALNLANVIIGPGPKPQGAVITSAESITMTPASGAFGTVTSTSYKMSRMGQWALIQGSFNAGTVAGGAASIDLPSGMTIDTTVHGSANRIFGNFWVAAGTNTAFYADGRIGALGFDGSDTNTIYFYQGSSTTGNWRTVVGTAADFFATSCLVNFQVMIAIAEWSGNGVVNLATNEVEYAYNSSTNDADDTTSFAYGPTGAQFISLTAARGKHVRFQSPILPTDRISFEVTSDSGVTWREISESTYVGSYTVQNSVLYGVSTSGVSTTDVLVSFATYRFANGTTYGGAGAAWSDISANATHRWRLKKSRAGVAVGFGLATSTDAGLAPAGVFNAGESKSVCLQEASATPSNPVSGSEAKLYMKGDKFIIQFNDAGTVRYKYLDLTGTGVTWVHTTSAP